MSMINFGDSMPNELEKRRRVTFVPSSYHHQHDLNRIYMDHCYSRPHNHLIESRFLRPTKTLFIPKPSRKSSNPLAPQQEIEDFIDVVTVPSEPPIIYDAAKAKYLMDECERHASFARVREDDLTGWEEKISRINWSPIQTRLFNGVVDILNSDYMSRLASTGIYNEPIVRRNIIHRSVSRFRQLMSTISWDVKWSQWLHSLLITNLPATYLGSYLDILQTLKSKLPSFVDKLMHTAPSNNRIGVTSNESLHALLKRPWDPVAPSLNQDKPKKLPGNPIIIVIPPSPVSTNVNQFKRLHRWINLLSNLATVMTVYTNISTNAHRMTMTNCLDQMFATTRAKVQEVKDEYPGRSIILAGFNAGASLALQVAQVESILCVLCLGFSLLSAEGKRGDPDDNLLELQCPVLFVIGQCSNTSLQEDMEDLRERMRVETGLIVVGSADDYLRVNKKKKQAESITQSVVDRCIVDEVGDFIGGLLLSPYPPQIRLSPSHLTDTSKLPGVERKRNNSNTSSMDSEPSSPTLRITRPVGRPPGTKSKMRPKWSIHMSQGLGIPHPLATHSNSVAPPPPPPPAKKEIRVLEDVVLTPSTTKYISNNGREIDLSKITLLGSMGAFKAGSIHGNIMIENKPKNYGHGHQVPKDMSKYITSKKQLLNKLPKPVKKLPYLSNPQSNLPPPTNLTSQDIMDLPIIFADDNQMLANNMIQPNDAPTTNLSAISPAVPKPATGNSGKIVFINKQVSLQPTTSFSPVNIKKSSAPIPVRTTSANSIKYAKIILSKRMSSDDTKTAMVGTLPPEISIKKIEPQPVNDIESQLIATSLPNPKFAREVFEGRPLEMLETRKRQLEGEDNLMPSKIFKTDQM